MPSLGGAAQGVLGRFITGSTFGPIGGAIGAGIGGLLGLFGKKKKSPTGIDYDAIRQRALQPARGVYDIARQKLNRQRALQGGYSPGFSTALSRMAREQSSALSDASIGAESEIARLKLAQPTGLEKANQWMNLIGRGAGALGTTFPDLFQGRGKKIESGLTGGSISDVFGENMRKSLYGQFGGR
jgi:hypothetical protein